MLTKNTKVMDTAVSFKMENCKNERKKNKEKHKFE